MNKKSFKVLSAAILLIFYSSLCLSQENVAQINALFKNPKIIEPGIVLEDFIKGKQWVRVIVALSKPVTSQQNRNFKEMTFRNNLRETVEKVRSNLIDSLDYGNIRITNTYVYIFGFSAEVNPEGLKQLTEYDEVVSINKDRLIKAHMAQGISLINAAGVRNIYSGSGIAVAICDTGIDTSHPMLGGGDVDSKDLSGFASGFGRTDCLIP